MGLIGCALYTIGHSNRSLEEFLQLLEEHEVEVVVDVRRLPGSNKHPQFNEDALGESLAQRYLELRRLEGLTGRRPVSRTVPHDTNGWWEHRSFHNYADHAMSDGFRADLATLIEWGAERRCALMCSEAVWWRCHRRIIADHLIAAGLTVTHIVGKGQYGEAELSGGAVLGVDGEVTYPVAGDRS